MTDNSPRDSPIRVVLLIPLRDDWGSVAELVRRLDEAISAQPYLVQLLLVDDGSIQEFQPSDFPPRFFAIRGIRILRLRRNLGHQRAIAIGLAHIETNIVCDAILVMDGDGEDTPAGVLELLHAFTGKVAIFAKRSRRTESLDFRLLYQVYKLLHRLLTGIKVQVGNFSILPSRYLRALVVTPELWNHYAAAVFRCGLPIATLPIRRGRRIAGTSKMNFVALTVHGISAISVFGDVVGIRLLGASVAGSLLAAAGIAIVIAIRLFTNRAIPGWATYSTGALAVILIQFITMASSFTFAFLANRANLSFVPVRDYELFVDRFEDIYQHG